MRKPIKTIDFYMRALPCLNKNQLRQNCFAPDSRQFLSNFRFLRCRLADASQDEKGEKCRKGALTGDMGLNPVSLAAGIFVAAL